MTVTSSVIVTNARQQAIEHLKLVLATLLAAYCWITAYGVYSATFTDQPDTRRYAGCMFPQFDGQAVTWARADGKVYCWESR